jgi:hypothetical protein
MAVSKRIKEYIKLNLPYYGSIPSKGRYKGVKGKAWDILSDYTRCRDYVKYGRCVATGKRILDWKESDAGHFITMAGHGALVGFDEMNVHMQSKNSNQLSSAEDGAEFEREIIRRYGEGVTKHLKATKLETVKADDLFFLGRIKHIYKLFQELKAKYPNHNYPDYI